MPENCQGLHKFSLRCTQPYGGQTYQPRAAGNKLSHMQFLQHGMLHIFALISLVCKCLVVSSSASAGPLQLEPSAPYPHLYRMYEIWYHSPVNVLSFVQYLCFVQSLFPWFSLPSLCAVISPRVSFLAWCSSFPMELLCLQP